jgi:hypothetical protein
MNSFISMVASKGITHFALEAIKMSVHDRVVKVISIWGHLPTLPDDTDELQLIWANSHEAVPFQPDAVTQLILDLKAEFKDPPSEDITITPSDFAPPGNVKTVDDLATAVGDL